MSARYSAFHPYWLMSREYGFKKPYGADDAIARSLYCGMTAVAAWDCEQEGALPTGGVFNLEFSPEGSLLIAACEKKSIQIFDPLTQNRIHSVNGAHSDCVNCVKFLDNRMFATCSDDTTIALWDVRNLKRRILTLHGHSNWVKNIDFSVKDKLLVTSGLDGSIYTWDINSYTERSLHYQQVFHAPDLMRCRLSPDAQQMVMCTTGGLLVIVHGLDLSQLNEDLQGFKPNLYRLMQTSKQLYPIAATYNHLFDSRRVRNRVEFVADFPKGNDAEVVCSLQIHPQGWAALSRNISHDDKSEWTCVHDIQPQERTQYKSTRDTHPDEGPEPATSRREGPAPATSRHEGSAPATSRRKSPVGRSRRLGRLVTYNFATAPTPEPSRARGSSGSGASSQSSFNEALRRRRQALLRTDMVQIFREHAAEEARMAAGDSGGSGDAGAGSSSGEAGQGTAGGAQGGAPTGSPGVSSIQNDVWEASMTIRLSRVLHAMASRGQVGRNFNLQHITGINTGIAGIAPSPQQSRSNKVRLLRMRRRVATFPPVTCDRSPVPDLESSDEDLLEIPKSRKFVRHNRNRLLYYIEEPNEGKGFIKELCFSSDGRVVCSPFGNGMRLLAFNDTCSELSHCVYGGAPQRLVEVGGNFLHHQDLVVSAKFSPRHHLLVTGCLAGKIVWYVPNCTM